MLQTFLTKGGLIPDGLTLIVLLGLIICMGTVTLRLTTVMGTGRVMEIVPRLAEQAMDVVTGLGMVMALVADTDL